MKQEKHNTNLAFQTWVAWMIKQGPSLQTQWLENLQQYTVPKSLNLTFDPFKEVFEAVFPKELLTAVAQEAESRFHNFLKGVHLYQASTYNRLASDLKVIWERGATRALDYGDFSHPNAPIVLCIPSLVNRSYILDLVEGNSMMRYLADKKLRPILVDWGELSDQERGFSLEDYIKQDLIPILEILSPQPIYVVGYCMGGLLAAALAQLSPQIKSLVLIATPWDFHADQQWLIPYLEYYSQFLEQIINSSNELSVEMIQFMLNALNPLSVIKKFRSLGENEPNTEILDKFSAVEDWLNDCVPLAPQVAKECLFGWYRDNTPNSGNWQILGQTITPKNLNIPTLAIIPQRDVIVPPASAQALADKIESCQIIKPQLGHIGAIIGHSARIEVWEPMIHFLKANS
ncbi:MAG: alpha/beta fold hydrolase [Alphaproteobacteria bacterium]|nr:alpha/beta fold hydrolase [Alphaproteobacteria bacterium]